MSVTDAPVATAPVRDPESGLRDLDARDWFIGCVCGTLILGILAALGSSFVPEAVRFPLLLLGFGMGVLAYLDQVTRLIRNRHNLVFGLITIAALQISFMVHNTYLWIPALIGAGSVFVFMLALTMTTGFAGGGDIKLSPIPGAILAAISPLAACLWLLFTFLSCLITMIIVKISGTGRKEAAMAPFMAIALVPALLVSGILTQTLGLA